jgi:hypothetical protein
MASVSIFPQHCLDMNYRVNKWMKISHSIKVVHGRERDQERERP